MKSLSLQRQKEILRGLQSCVNAYLLAKTHAEFWREKMTDWERQELARYEYKADPKWHERNSRFPVRITNPKDTHLLAQPDDWNAFFEERQHFVDSLNVPGLKPGNCPACVAECLQRDTEHLLIETAAETLPELGNVTVDALLCAGLDAYHKMINLVVCMVISLPGWKAPVIAKRGNQ